MTHLFTRFRLSVFALVLQLSFIACHGVHAAESNTVVTDNVKTKLLSEYSQVEAGQTVSVLLQIDIREGWHTYWRNPGDSGQATAIKWTLPRGVVASDIEWPYPERQYVGPVANYGYHGVALHRVQLTIPEDWPTNKPVSISANATWLVCEEECIPEKGHFEMQLPVVEAAQVADANASEFNRFEQLLPSPLPVKSGYQYSDNSGIRFEFSPVDELISASEIEYFPYDWGVIQAPVKQTVIIDDAFVSISSLKGDLKLSKPLKGVLIVRNKEGGHKAYQVESQPGPLLVDGASIVPSDETASISLLGALLFALIGGLILNLMPCVFPVLSMKALSLVSHADESPAVIKRHGLVYTFGVLASFAALGIALLLLKSAGHQIGWGFQLQSPLFVGLIVIVLFVLGLSLSGFVEIGASLMGVGSGLAQHSGYKGSFFTGVLAVIVATPCTAPFMGPAVGFALTQPSIITLAVLLSLGLGLALPYLLLCYFPALSSRLPKPGLWMKKLQQFLAFPMYATAAWLIWVFGLQAGINGVFALLIVCILVALAIWLWQSAREPSGDTLWPNILRGLAVITLLAVIALTFSIANTSNEGGTNSENALSSANYEAFSIERLNELQSNNSPVFVNMTAAWCITCLANEKVALSTSELKAHFKNNNVTYLKGDWTNQDPVITSYLESFGRSSVPLYVYYPKKGKSVVLPQILSVAGVIESMESAELK